MEVLLELLAEFWKVVREMAPFLLLGFFLAGVFHVLIPTQWVVRQLGGRGLWPVVKAALIGIPVPLCSCGILPVAASLRKAGAGRGPTASFLISGPETDIDNIILTWGIMGPLFSVYRVAVSMVNSITAGVLIDRFGGPEPPPPAPASDAGCSTSSPEPASCCASQSAVTSAAVGLRHGFGRKALDMLRDCLGYGFVMLPRDLGASLLVGLLIAAVLTLAAQWLLPLLRGSDPMAGILGAMLLGLPMYVCSTSSIPIAASLVYNAGLTPGAALAFMIAGPATNAAAVSLLWRLLGPRATVLYLASIALTAFGAGMLLDNVFMPPGHAFCTSCIVPLPTPLLDLLGAAMLALLLWPVVERLLARLRRNGHAVPAAMAAADCCTAHSVGPPLAPATCTHIMDCTCNPGPAPGGTLKLRRPGLGSGHGPARSE